MTDDHGRTIEYLRVSLTDRCNLQCRYCMPKDAPMFEEKSLLGSVDLLRIVKAFAELGIRHIRLTGGEPLLRKDVVPLTERIKRIPGIETVTLTTNGILLKRLLPELMAAGLDGVNISLDTMNRQKYERITGRDELPAVLDSVEETLRTGLPLKVNCVPFEDFGELEAFTGLVKHNLIAVRFIEMMPIGEGKRFVDRKGPRGFGTSDGLLASLKARYPDLRPDGTRHGNGPAVYYRSKEFMGSIGLIDAMNHSFCSSCNRIRLTADGFLKLCLCFQTGVDLKEYLGGTDEELKQAIFQAVKNKPLRHEFDALLKDPEENSGYEERRMSQIGG